MICCAKPRMCGAHFQPIITSPISPQPQPLYTPFPPSRPPPTIYDHTTSLSGRRTSLYYATSPLWEQGTDRQSNFIIENLIRRSFLGIFTGWQDGFGLDFQHKKRQNVYCFVAKSVLLCNVLVWEQGTDRQSNFIMGRPMFASKLNLQILFRHLGVGRMGLILISRTSRVGV